MIVSATVPAAANNQPFLAFGIILTGGQSNGINLQNVVDNILISGTIVPEPATIAGGLLGVLGLCWFQRRRLIRLRCVCGAPSANLLLGSTGCQPVGFGSLPKRISTYIRIYFRCEEVCRRQAADDCTRAACAPQNSPSLHPASRHSKRLACRSSHHASRSQSKDDLDLTPPEEIRAGRIRRFVFLGAIAACVLGIAIYFAAPSIGGAIKAWQARRQAREAFALIDQRKWTEAAAKARDAYFLRPSEPESWRALARVTSRTAQWASALEWWKKVDDAHRLTVEDRRDYVSAGLATGEISVAAKQVEALLAQRAGPAPIDIIFAGQVAARQSDPVLAVDYAERALADQRAEPYDILSAATLILSVTNPQSPLYASAWQKVEAVARDPKNPGSLDALAVLANEEALPPMPAIGGNASLSLESKPTPRPTPATQEAASAEATAAKAAVLPVRSRGEGGSPPLRLHASANTCRRNPPTLSLSLSPPLRHQLQPDGR